MGSVSFPGKAANYYCIARFFWDFRCMWMISSFCQNSTKTSQLHLTPNFFWLNPMFPYVSLWNPNVSVFFSWLEPHFTLFCMVHVNFHHFFIFLSLLESKFCQKNPSEIHHFPSFCCPFPFSLRSACVRFADQSGHGAHGAADVLRGLRSRGADPLDVGGHRDLLWAGAAQFTLWLCQNSYWKWP